MGKGLFKQATAEVEGHTPAKKKQALLLLHFCFEHFKLN